MTIFSLPVFRPQGENRQHKRESTLLPQATNHFVVVIAQVLEMSNCVPNLQSLISNL